MFKKSYSNRFKILYKYFPHERNNNSHIYSRNPKDISDLTSCSPFEIAVVDRGYIFFYLYGEDSLNAGKSSSDEGGIIPMAELRITSDFSVFVTSAARFHFEKAKETLRSSTGPLHRVDFRLERPSLKNITVSTLIPDDIARAFIEYNLDS